jgi:hypothetical protein
LPVCSQEEYGGVQDLRLLWKESEQIWSRTGRKRCDWQRKERFEMAATLVRIPFELLNSSSLRYLVAGKMISSLHHEEEPQ